MSQYCGHISQLIYVTHSSGVSLLAMADSFLDGYLTQSQPIHCLVIYSQEFESEVIDVRVCIKALGVRQSFWITCK